MRPRDRRISRDRVLGLKGQPRLGLSQSNANVLRSDPCNGRSASERRRCRHHAFQPSSRHPLPIPLLREASGQIAKVTKARASSICFHLLLASA
ncbi:hypothetical protein PGT21_003900 [Puccinia graminis f. sp. tritici]|uniref:Uncharacterized protein n=1 Tax=Puccinia graminis f. sp. tritici TaxID=56615 RepID=A0A5B0M9A5_PUCGR|nr:hypothetical protein PGT21_003900 [Puccinia graminis f. sp. tritici]